MLKIIIASAYRSLLKYNHISIINLLGLVLGITSFLFTLHYLIYEFSYDSFIPQHESVYRINFKVEKEGQTIFNGAKTPRGLYHALQDEIPEIEANGFAYFEKCVVEFENINFANQDFLWVSEDFEKVFPLDMIDGIADYSRPRTGIISLTSAKALFGSTNPIGKIMKVNGEMPIEITGIFKDLPTNTHLTAKYFVSVKTWVEMGAIGERGGWYGNAWWNYIRLKEGSSQSLAEVKINGFIDKYMRYLSEDNRKGFFYLQPLKDLHFIRGIEGEMGAVTNYSSLVNLIIIALVTLLIAWLNYVNLSTAHAQTRSLQIGMRKLIGATNIHLWHQSLAESFFLNFTAIIFSFILYFSFKNIFAQSFNIQALQTHVPFEYIILILLATVGAGILFSSIYHGVELAGIAFLPGRDKNKRGKFKKGLVIIQLALSIVFLTSTIFVYKQISFMKNKDLGVELDEVIVCTGPASLNSDHRKRQRFEGFKSEILSYADFQSATFNLFVPGQEPRVGFKEFHNLSMGINPGVQFFENNAGHEFIETYQLKLLAGNAFNKNPEQNHNDIIVNETSSKLLGFDTPEEAIGRAIFRKGNDTTRLQIIGVLADYHNEGLQKPIYPMVWNNQFPSEFGYFALRFNTKNIEGSVKQLVTTWNKHYPKDNIDFTFANEQFNKQYESESRFSKFYLWLTVLSIGIASMGLYGLILFYLEKQKKEIGIHKINGASIFEVLLQLNKEFIKWVIVAFFIATPVAWYAINKWLENFAYQTSLSWWIFALSGLLTLIIALTTVSLQSWKAATKNPIEVLRYE